MSFPKLTTPAPYKTNLGRLPTIKRILRQLAAPLDVTPATQGRKLPLRTSGPRHLPFGQAPILRGKGPGEPPAGWAGAFPGGASRDEWVALFWPLWKVLGCKGDPRQGPFTGCSVGNKSFRYQANFGGGRLVRGGQVVDAEVTIGGLVIAIRLLTARYHAEAKREQQVRDIRGKIALAKYAKVCDLWTMNVLDDETGEAACRAVADCVRGKSTPSPFEWGYRRPRPKVRKV